MATDEQGHELHRWVDRDGVPWACIAYDHGPFCRRCHRLDPATELGATESALLDNVERGYMTVTSTAGGDWRFSITPEGEAATRSLIEADPEAFDLDMRLAMSESPEDRPGED